MSHSDYPSVRLILRPPLGEEDVERYAGSQHWRKEYDRRESSAAGTLREVAWRVSTEVMLHYTVDDVTNCPYIFFTAPWRQIGRGFIRHAEQNLRVFTHDDLLAAFDESHGSEDRANALLRLALGSPRELDDDSFDRIVSALQDQDDKVRRAAVYATSYTPSALYRPYLRRIAQRDPVKAIRKDAKEMLLAYDDALIGEP